MLGRGKCSYKNKYDPAEDQLLLLSGLYLRCEPLKQEGKRSLTHRELN